MRVCLDTNVVVAAFATRGLAADLFRLILAEHELVMPEVVLGELARILPRKLKLPAARVAAIEQVLREHDVVPKPARVLPQPVLRDRADAWVLASAVAGAADVLVTGDQDLLVVAADAPLPILDPRAFWTLVRAAGGG